MFIRFRQNLRLGFILALSVIVLIHSQSYALSSFKEVRQLCKSRDYLEAVTCLDKIVNEPPHNTKTLFRALKSRAEFLYALGEYSRSLTDLEQAKSLKCSKDDKVEILNLTARCHEALGQLDQAIAVRTNLQLRLYGGP